MITGIYDIKSANTDIRSANTRVESANIDVSITNKRSHSANRASEKAKQDAEKASRKLGSGQMDTLLNDKAATQALFNPPCEAPFAQICHPSASQAKHYTMITSVKPTSTIAESHGWAYVWRVMLDFLFQLLRLAPPEPHYRFTDHSQSFFSCSYRPSQDDRVIGQFEMCPLQDSPSRLRVF